MSYVNFLTKKLYFLDCSSISLDFKEVEKPYFFLLSIKSNLVSFILAILESDSY